MWNPQELNLCHNTNGRRNSENKGLDERTKELKYVIIICLFSERITLSKRCIKLEHFCQGTGMP